MTKIKNDKKKRVSLTLDLDTIYRLSYIAVKIARKLNMDIHVKAKRDQRAGLKPDWSKVKPNKSETIRILVEKMYLELKRREAENS